MSRLPAVSSLLLLTVGACAYLPDNRPVPPPNPPVYCYRTLGRVACYDEPQTNMGTLVNAQLPPAVIVPAAPVVLMQPATAVVTTPVGVTPATTIRPPVVAAPASIDPDAPPTKYFYDPVSDTAVAAPLPVEPAFTDAPVLLSPR